MNKLLTLLATALLFSVTNARAASVADGKPEPKPKARELSPVSLNMRVGAALPSGRIDAGTTADQVFGFSMTGDLLLDVRLGSRFVVSPYAGYLFGSAGSMFTCPESTKDSCGASGVQVGGAARYTFARSADVDVWAGYAFSRQWLAVTQTGASARFAGNDHHVSIGADFFVNKSNDTRMGVYLDLAMGRYDESSFTVAGAGTIESAEPGIHQWTTIGGQFVF